MLFGNKNILYDYHAAIDRETNKMLSTGKKVSGF